MVLCVIVMYCKVGVKFNFCATLFLCSFVASMHKAYVHNFYFLLLMVNSNITDVMLRVNTPNKIMCTIFCMHHTISPYQLYNYVVIRQFLCVCNSCQKIE